MLAGEGVGAEHHNRPEGPVPSVVSGLAAGWRGSSASLSIPGQL